jgi:two-component system phosphate regulon sensor histidine kinase PhoR
VILDSSGQPVLEDELAADHVTLANAPLGWLFPHLRLAVVAPPHDPSKQVFWSVLAQLLPLGIAMVLGLIGIVVQQTANRRERELFARQTDFMARVTHELKTPLAGIRVMAETLQMGAKHDPKTVDRFLDRIIHESENLGARIDEVLTAARKPAVSARTPVHPEQLAAEVVETWRPRFQHAGAVLETDLRPCHPIPADPPLLRDALGNLLDNALKYRRPGVRGRVLVRTAETSRWVLIEVVDNGLGVPVPMRRQIFERFARVEGPGRGKAGGHGLGLSFVADTADAHHGMVECTDGFDGGARFRIKLRRRRP